MFDNIRKELPSILKGAAIAFAGAALAVCTEHLIPAMLASPGAVATAGAILSVAVNAIRKALPAL